MKNQFFGYYYYFLNVVHQDTLYEMFNNRKICDKYFYKILSFKFNKVLIENKILILYENNQFYQYFNIFLKLIL